MGQRKLTRSRNRLIAGVCAGIAQYLGWNINLVRLIYALLTLFSVGFPGILAYIILWIVMPSHHASARW